jgi:hypothetical protein
MEWSCLHQAPKPTSPLRLPQPSQLTQNEKSQAIEDGTHKGQDVEEEGQLGVKVRVSGGLQVLDLPPTLRGAQR